jgi:hypothetical protein
LFIASRHESGRELRLSSTSQPDAEHTDGECQRDHTVAPTEPIRRERPQRRQRDLKLIPATDRDSRRQK